MRWLWMIVAASYIALFSSESRAQSASDPREWADSFFETLFNEGEDEAFRLLREESFLGQTQPGGMSYLADKLREFKSMSGGLIDYELAEQKTLGTRLVRLVYVVSSPRFPLVWYLDMYKNGQGWQVWGCYFAADPNSIWGQTVPSR